eukprot:751046-Hanusia_phi.AAC.6
MTVARRLSLSTGFPVSVSDPITGYGPLHRLSNVTVSRPSQRVALHEALLIRCGSLELTDRAGLQVRPISRPPHRLP